MELLEYQAKELFRMIGIPILPSQTIKDSRKIKQLQIPYPVVLKSQVRSGGRGKVGGVRFVANTIDAIAAARTIFNLSILGEYPEVILAEAHYNAEREFFLAIVLDYDLQCPILLGSASGGMNVNALLANLQQVIVEEDFSLFYARRLAASMGLSGKLICSVSEIIAKMYRLFQEKDLDLIEINPLGVNAQGELMALDGKITINDHALLRQPIVQTFKQVSERQQSKFLPANWKWLDWHHEKGKIAIVSNSFDLALLSWDLLNQNRVTPARGIVIQENFIDSHDCSQFYQDCLAEILRELMSIKPLKAIFINIRQTETLSDKIFNSLNKCLQSFLVLNSSAKSETSSNLTNYEQLAQILSESEAKLEPALIVRLSNLNSASNLENNDQPKNMHVFSNLESAISKAVSVVKSS